MKTAPKTLTAKQAFVYALINFNRDPDCVHAYKNNEEQINELKQQIKKLEDQQKELKQDMIALAKESYAKDQAYDLLNPENEYSEAHGNIYNVQRFIITGLKPYDTHIYNGFTIDPCLDDSMQNVESYIVNLADRSNGYKWDQVYSSNIQDVYCAIDQGEMDYLKD